MQAHRKPGPTKNVAKEKSADAIALDGGLNGQDGHQFVSFKTGKGFIARHWTVMPVTQMAIDRVHSNQNETL